VTVGMNFLAMGTSIGISFRSGSQGGVEGEREDSLGF